METKICTKCQTAKSLDDFSWKNKAQEKRASWCKECFRASYRERYANDSSEKERVRAQSNRNKETNKAKIIEYLRENPCVDCGESDPIVLQFDHKEMLKVRGKRVSSYLNRSWKRVMEEIEKCEVRCANCHMRRTARQMDWYRLNTCS